MKRAFTLIELMISIVLTVLVVFFLYRTVDIQRDSNTVLTKKSKSIIKQSLLFKLLHDDIYESNESSIALTFNKDYNVFYLHTKNSLHAIPWAYVAYYVNSKKKTLVRVESAYPFQFPVKMEKIKYIFVDILAENIEKFRIFSKMQSKKRRLLPGEAPPKKDEQKGSNKLLFFVQENGKNVVFEISK